MTVFELGSIRLKFAVKGLVELVSDCISVAFGHHLVVDTHVQRLAQRLGWSKHNEPEKIEVDLCAILPRSEWDHTGHVLIFHGRRCCYARKPDCAGCSVNEVCPAAFDAEHVGRKEARHRVPARPKLPAAKKTAATPAKKTAATPAKKTAASPAKKSAAKKIAGRFAK